MDFMGLGPLEILLVLILGFIFLGPEKLPGMAAKAGEWYRKFQKATSDLSKSVSEEITKETKPIKEETKQLMEETRQLTDEAKQLKEETNQLMKETMPPEVEKGKNRNQWFCKFILLAKILLVWYGIVHFCENLRQVSGNCFDSKSRQGGANGHGKSVL